MQTRYSKNLEMQSAHSCNVNEEDYERVRPIMETIERLASIEHAIYAVYDMHRNNYLLVSEEQKRLFGYGQNEQQHFEIDQLYQSIHPDDLAFVLETDRLVYDHYAQMKTEEKKDYKLVRSFRTKNMEGIYKHYLHQSVVFEQDRNGKAWLVLVISHLLSDPVSSNKPKRWFINMKTGKLHLFNNDGDSTSNSLLSKRELEVLVLLARGYDSVNISDKLHISVNTVNNHRQNILRKTQSENTTQAVLYCKQIGLI